MSRIIVRQGIQAVGEGLTSLVLVGKKSALQVAKFEGKLQEVAQNFVSDSAQWSSLLSRAPASGRLPLHFDLANLIAIPDGASRNNTASNAHSLYRDFKSINFSEDVKNVHIILLSDYSDVLPHVAAIARTFFKFSLKTSGLRDLQVNIDVVCEQISSEDTKFLGDLCESIRETARLIDTPANILTTDALTEEAVNIGTALGAKITVIRGDELLEKGFGGIYHVGKAGPTPPSFVVLTHEVEGSEENIALVGKGVVYDTGGMQIKTKTGMPNMKRDMGGAAGMLETFAALVKNNFRQTLHACLCIVENHVSPIAK
uniref:Cytosol aminopeptidase domain-containing protein n=1 Tax=Caenorhabditis japonica TaxID=281687 RepID=A0A8R1DVW1_CAEJA